MDNKSQVTYYIVKAMVKQEEKYSELNDRLSLTADGKRMRFSLEVLRSSQKLQLTSVCVSQLELAEFKYKDCGYTFTSYGSQRLLLARTAKLVSPSSTLSEKHSGYTATCHCRKISSIKDLM